jgi:hypothetical protein
MGISQITTAIAVSLAGLLPASCHKTAATTKAAPPAAIVKSASAANATDPLARNLGDVAMTNHNETCVQLGDGKNCIFTPRMLDKNNVQITLSVESKTAEGLTKDLSVTQVVTRSGKPLEVAVGDFNLTLTPRVNLETDLGSN